MADNDGPTYDAEQLVGRFTNRELAYLLASRLPFGEEVIFQLPIQKSVSRGPEFTVDVTGEEKCFRVVKREPVREDGYYVCFDATYMTDIVLWWDGSRERWLRAEGRAAYHSENIQVVKKVVA